MRYRAVRRQLALFVATVTVLLACSSSSTPASGPAAPAIETAVPVASQTWELVSPSEISVDSPEFEPLALKAVNGHFVAIGESPYGAVDSETRAWFSVDGREWIESNLHEIAAESNYEVSGQRLGEYGGRIYAQATFMTTTSSGLDLPVLTQDVAFWTSDGRTWSFEETPNQAFIGEPCLVEDPSKPVDQAASIDTCSKPYSGCQKPDPLVVTATDGGRSVTTEYEADFLASHVFSEDKIIMMVIVSDFWDDPGYTPPTHELEEWSEECWSESPMQAMYASFDRLRGEWSDLYPLDGGFNSTQPATWDSELPLAIGGSTRTSEQVVFEFRDGTDEFTVVELPKAAAEQNPVEIVAIDSTAGALAIGSDSGGPFFAGIYLLS